MRLGLLEILDFYDVPQLFVAKDAVDTLYLCLFYGFDDEDRQLCIAVSISGGRLNDFLTGHIDLRQIYLEPEQSLFDVIVDGNVIEAVIRNEAPSDEMLPDEGYSMDYNRHESNEMIEASHEEGRTIIRLAFNYETTNHSISTDVLADTVHNFQGIVKKAYKRVTRSRDDSLANLFVRATMAASFDLELFSNESVNIFGGSKVADTLDMISPLFGDDDEGVANCLATFKNVLANYKRLLKSLSENRMSLKCKWVKGYVGEMIGECPISQERVQSLFTLASNLEMLQERQIVFEGAFFMANVRNGKWGFNPINDDRRKYGICLERELLTGIVLQNRLYRITCTEKPSHNPNTGVEYKTYVLTDLQSVE